MPHSAVRRADQDSSHAWLSLTSSTGWRFSGGLKRFAKGMNASAYTSSSNDRAVRFFSAKASMSCSLDDRNFQKLRPLYLHVWQTLSSFRKLTTPESFIMPEACAR